MIKRLEQVAALVVAAGLAIVSYWLFFSWAQGGGADHRRPQPRQGERSQLGAPFSAGARIAVAVSPTDGAGGGRSARLKPRPVLPPA